MKINFYYEKDASFFENAYAYYIKRKLQKRLPFIVERLNLKKVPQIYLSAKNTCPHCYYDLKYKIVILSVEFIRTIANNSKKIFHRRMKTLKKYDICPYTFVLIHELAHARQDEKKMFTNGKFSKISDAVVVHYNETNVIKIGNKIYPRHEDLPWEVDANNKAIRIIKELHRKNKHGILPKKTLKN